MIWRDVKEVLPRPMVRVLCAWKTGDDHFDYDVLHFESEGVWYDFFGHESDVPDYWTTIFKPIPSPSTRGGNG